jgi:hypothetical protein
LYLARFPGQQVTSMSVDTQLPGNVDEVWTTLREQLGATDVGKAIDAQGVRGRVERISPYDGFNEMLVSLDDPIPGFLEITARDIGDGKAMVWIEGYLFSEDAAAYVERERGGWKDWLERLAASVA